MKKRGGFGSTVVRENPATLQGLNTDLDYRGKRGTAGGLRPIRKSFVLRQSLRLLLLDDSRVVRTRRPLPRKKRWS